VSWGAVEPDRPWQDGDTLQFVNQGVGSDRLP
jgi:hypothetical protein